MHLPRRLPSRPARCVSICLRHLRLSDALQVPRRRFGFTMRRRAVGADRSSALDDFVMAWQAAAATATASRAIVDARRAHYDAPLQRSRDAGLRSFRGFCTYTPFRHSDERDKRHGCFGGTRILRTGDIEIVLSFDDNDGTKLAQNDTFILTDTSQHGREWQIPANGFINHFTKRFRRRLLSRALAASVKPQRSRASLLSPLATLLLMESQVVMRCRFI